MGLTAGTRIGPNEILAEVGAGGMGEVDGQHSPDGKQFVMVEERKAASQTTTRLQVVLNWFDKLRARVPASP